MDITALSAYMMRLMLGRCIIERRCKHGTVGDDDNTYNGDDGYDNNNKYL